MRHGSGVHVGSGAGNARKLMSRRVLDGKRSLVDYWCYKLALGTLDLKSFVLLIALLMPTLQNVDDHIKQQKNPLLKINSSQYN